MLHIAPDNIEAATGRLLPCRAVEEDQVVSNNFRFTKGDVLYTKLRPYLNKVVVAPFDGLCSSDVLPIRAHINASYLRYWMLSPRFLSQVIPRQTGVTLPRVSRKALAETFVPVAPLPEQRRIVEVIESNFARLDAAIVTLRRAEERLARYPSYILHQSMEINPSSNPGNGLSSTEAWRADWPGSTMGDILREPLRNGITTRPTSHDTGVRTLTLTAVTSGDFSIKNTKPCGVPQEDAEGLWLKSGDILVERSNTRELVGTSALYRGPERFAIYPDMVIRARVRESASPEFITYVLKSPLARRYFQAKAKGVAGNMPKIDQPTILDLPVPLPSLKIQLSVVERIEYLLSAAKYVEREVEGTLERCASLRQSILKIAFEGRLVPQDPLDEPASALLERIKHERSPPSQPMMRRRRSATAS